MCTKGYYYEKQSTHYRSPKRREGEGVESLFKKIMAEIFPFAEEF